MFRVIESLTSQTGEIIGTSVRDFFKISDAAKYIDEIHNRNTQIGLVLGRTYQVEMIEA